ncbi:MAG: hypothetical protein ACLP7A_07935 [Desulfobaccales bacterium]
MRRLQTVLLAVSAVFPLLLVSPPQALALSFQWTAEGSYVHQTAHLLFTAALLFFIWEIYHTGLQRFGGFRWLTWCWGVLALWNLNAFVGNWSKWTMSNPVILGHGFSRQLLMTDTHAWLFYLTQIANFLLLPLAFYLFYRGLKLLAREPRPEGPGAEGP